MINFSLYSHTHVLTRRKRVLNATLWCRNIGSCRKFRGEHSDAQELAALYVSSGVPIYPKCRGFSYQTLIWRMSVEAQDMRTSDESGSTWPSREIAGGVTYGDVTTRTSEANAVRGFIAQL